MEAPPIQTNPQPQPQVIVIQAPAAQPARIYEKYQSTLSLILGIVRMVTGVSCIILQIVAMILSSTHDYYRGFRLDGFSFAATGIWCGIFVSFPYLIVHIYSYINVDCYYRINIKSVYWIIKLNTVKQIHSP